MSISASPTCCLGRAVAPGQGQLGCHLPSPAPLSPAVGPALGPLRPAALLGPPGPAPLLSPPTVLGRRSGTGSWCGGFPLPQGTKCGCRHPQPDLARVSQCQPSSASASPAGMLGARLSLCGAF